MRLRRTLFGIVAAAVAVVSTAIPANAGAQDSDISGSGELSTTSVVAPKNVSPTASVSARVFNIRCFSNGITFTARTQENGVSGVRQFSQTAVEQVFTTGGWRNITPKVQRNSSRFPNDFRNFFFSFNWAASHPANGASYRVVWQGFYLNGSGFPIAQTRPVAVNCL